MIVKKTKQLGSFKRGINLYVPKRKTSAAAPSGIVAATAGNLLVTFWIWNNEEFFKLSNTAWFGGVEEYTTELLWDQNNNRWLLIGGQPAVAQAISPVGTSAIIPTEGWVYAEGSGPAITITAA